MADQATDGDDGMSISAGVESFLNFIGTGNRRANDVSEDSPESLRKKLKSEQIPDTPETPLESPRPGSAGGPGAGCRYDSSLGLLTKKFVHLLQNAENGILDLNTAATALSVQKRRIYDITNVLEGIGLIEKKSKNNIMWKGVGITSTGEAKQESDSLKTQLHQLSQHESMLDDYINVMQNSLRDLAEDGHHALYAFVTHDDIRNLQCMQGETVVAIKAPSGTTLEVPDPDEGMETGERRYQVFLKSHTGSIDVFLVSHLDEQLPSADTEQSTDRSTMETLTQTTADVGQGDVLPPATSTAAHTAVVAEPPATAATNESLLKLSPMQPDPDYYFNNFADDEGICDLFGAED